MTLHKFGYSESEDKTDEKKILELNKRIEELRYQLNKAIEDVQKNVYVQLDEYEKTILRRINSQLDNERSNILKVSDKLNEKIKTERDNIDTNIKKLLNETSEKLIKLFSELNSTVKNNIFKTISGLNSDLETEFNDKIKDLKHIIERMRDEQDGKIAKNLETVNANHSILKQHVLKLIDDLEKNVKRIAKKQMEVNNKVDEKLGNLITKSERFENFETKTHNAMEIMDLKLHQAQASIIFIKDHLHIK